jgi:hypothetical protein
MCIDVAGPGIDSCSIPVEDCGGVVGGGGIGGMCHVTETETCNMNDPNSLCGGGGDIILGCSDDPYPPDPYDAIDFDAQMNLQHNE